MRAFFIEFLFVYMLTIEEAISLCWEQKTAWPIRAQCAPMTHNACDSVFNMRERCVDFSQRVKWERSDLHHHTCQSIQVLGFLVSKMANINLQFKTKWVFGAWHVHWANVASRLQQARLTCQLKLLWFTVVCLLFSYSYAVSSKIEPFYKGGKVQVSLLLCVVCHKCCNSLELSLNDLILHCYTGGRLSNDTSKEEWSKACKATKCPYFYCLVWENLQSLVVVNWF